MIIFPAIDIQNKKVVRLLQGKFDNAKEYSDDPLFMAEKWIKDGAQWLHIVDLDAAKTSGKINNRDIIIKIAKSVNIPVQMGGGIRTDEDISYLINNGISRVVLGTKAITDIKFLKRIIKEWEDKIAVSLDCSNGFLTKLGWTSVCELKAINYVKELESIGLKYLIYTDIAHDGMLDGPNIAALKELLSVTNIPTIASGGISSIEDIRGLKMLEDNGIIGAITGKAIYEGNLDLKEAIKVGSK